jgi:uncharacterized membrane protein
MPYCSQCGNPVSAADVYCARCGARQPVASLPLPAGDPLAGIAPRTASIFCYIPVVGWIASIVVLASERFRYVRPVRFHAFQGLYLGVAWVLNGWVLGNMFWVASHLRFVHDMVNIALLAMSIFMMVKASHEETYSLPVFGELAERSVAEH